MIGDFSYYTGMTFEGYAADLGFPVVSGGRYDNLLQQFGRPAPATGFALKTTRIVELIGEGAEEPARVLIGYDADGLAGALAEASRLRGDGYVVVTERMAAAEAEALAAASASAGGTLRHKGTEYGRFVGYVNGKGAGKA